MHDLNQEEKGAIDIDDGDSHTLPINDAYDDEEGKLLLIIKE